MLKWVAALLIICALARPQKVDPVGEPPKPVVDIILCLDTSLSMSAMDFNPLDRLAQAKKSAESFIRKREFDRIGLVVFGGRALTQCPLTLDHETLINFLRTIAMNATQVDGTAIGTAIALSAEQLSKSEAKTKLIILLTDGRSNVGSLDPVTAATAAGELKIKIYTIGTAVPGGGWVEVNHPVFGKRMMQMAEDLDEPALRQIASLTGGQYHRVTSAENFEEIYNAIDHLEKTKVEIYAHAQYKDIYLWPLLAALFFVTSAMVLERIFWRVLPL